MLKVFPTCLFAPDGIEADVTGRVIDGGESLSGLKDTIATDGGGFWFAEFQNAYLDEPQVAKAWRAVSAWLKPGRAIIVPFKDLRHQPTLGSVTVPHSDDTPFSDESEYEQGDSDVTLAADAALRATLLELDISYLPEPLVGGERLSIDHTILRHRPYEISEITEQTETTATVRINPPLREATTAGAPVNFHDPLCVMRLDGDMRSPTTFGFVEGGSARFVEHFPGPEGYE